MNLRERPSADEERHAATAYSYVWPSWSDHKRKIPQNQRDILSMVEAAGIEPASASPTFQDLHA
jgi:hypothetical protein